MTWSPQQDAALKAVASWLQEAKPKQIFRLFGYAGTGKTTLAKEIAACVTGPVAFGAFTGKAAHVLRQKGCSNASTIHSMIYRLDDNQIGAEPRFVLNPDAEVGQCDLIIIDEVSMVGEDLAKDLLSFGAPVLVLGDPAQLPPVKGSGFFTEHEPDVMLTEVHRQAEGSPIIRMATTIRTGGRLEFGEFDGSSVIRRVDVDQSKVLDSDQILVGLNRTRHSYNARVRALKQIASPKPVVGEKLVCLRNDRVKKLLNGSLWSVIETRKASKVDRRAGVTRLSVLPDDAGGKPLGVDVKVKDEFWDGREGELDWTEMKGTEQFTFGYALTVHKSQGSQWDDVIVFDESSSFRDDAARWLYTAVTRAAKTVTVVQQ